jgi:hypothetical protein
LQQLVPREKEVATADGNPPLSHRPGSGPERRQTRAGPEGTHHPRCRRRPDSQRRGRRRRHARPARGDAGLGPAHRAQPCLDHGSHPDHQAGRAYRYPWSRVR